MQHDPTTPQDGALSEEELDTVSGGHQDLDSSPDTRIGDILSQGNG